MLKLAHLPERAVIAVTGPDRVPFLQGLVSNDVALVAPGTAVWAALLTPQGKWLADFFILSDGERLLLDCERAQAPMLVQRLSRYRLRADAALQPTALRVHVAWDGQVQVEPGSVAAPDPRHPDAGWRILSPSEREWEADEADWDRHRLLLGLPDGARDCESEKTVLLEAGFDELHGISWTKGCYMGQELTARTRYRGLLKRRLVPVTSDGALSAPGTPITHEGIEVGAMRSSRDGLGIALLRIEHLHGSLQADGYALHTRIPDWMRLPVEPA
nr:folate-binding protein [uncultured Lichenicoccus sp.]